MVMFENGIRKKSTTQPLRIISLEYVTDWSYWSKKKKKKRKKRRRGAKEEEEAEKMKNC